MHDIHRNLKHLVNTNNRRTFNLRAGVVRADEIRKKNKSEIPERPVHKN